MQSIPPTMSLAEAADTLKIHPHSMEKLIRSGEVPAGRIGRAYVLMTRDVLAYAEKVILSQTADRLIGTTTSVRRGRPRASLRTASASGGSYVQ